MQNNLEKLAQSIAIDQAKHIREALGEVAVVCLVGSSQTAKSIAQTEIFSPILSVMKINDFDDSIDLIQKQSTGNGVCLFTRNMYCTEKFIANTDAGMVGINVGVRAPHPYIPCGGIKESLVGNNKVQGKEGFDFFTQNKVSTIRVAAPPSRLATDAIPEQPAEISTSR